MTKVTVSAEGKDTPACVSEQTEPCLTIGYAVQHGANHIHLLGRLSNKAEHISLDVQNIPTSSNGTCNVVILGDGGIITDFTMSLQSNKMETGNILFKNLTIVKSHITVRNIAASFTDCDLIDAVIKDYNIDKKSPHVQITLEQSTMNCNDSEKYGIFLKYMPIVRLNIEQSAISSCGLQLSVADLFLVISSSTMQNVQTNVTVRSHWNVPTIVRLDGSIFHSIPTTDALQMILSLNSPYVYMSVDNCTFSAFPLAISLHEHFYHQSIASMFVTHSQFNGSVKIGNGGALMISAIGIDAKVYLSNCLFSENRAIKGEGAQQGLGGAVYIEGTSFVQAENCTFVDDTVLGPGVALHISLGDSIFVTNCTFDYQIKSTQEDLISIVSIDGNLKEFNASIYAGSSLPSTSTYRFEVLSATKVFEIDMNVHCPSWYIPNKEYKISQYHSGQNVTQMFERFLYECLPCSEGYYIISGKHKHFSSEETLKESDRCEECPYGAICSGHHVNPRPNYWGYMEDGELVFMQCPPDYCCAGNDNAPCTDFDVCAPNRTGILCGSCKEGLSVSILTGECIPDSECEEDYLFWMFSTPIALAYALWYTFKGDILAYFLMLALPVFGWINTCFSGIKLKRPMSSQNYTLDQNPYSKKENIVTKNWINLKRMSSEQKPRELSENSGASLEEAIGRKSSQKSQKRRKGYFDIVTFYVQMSAAMKISVEFSDIDNSKSVLDYISDNIDRVLNFALSDITIKFCPISELSTRGKHISILAFLCGIYVTWGVVYSCVSFLWLCSKKRPDSKLYKTLDSLRLKFIGGLVEIIKYTYEGFCEVIFLSLVCVEIRGSHVWWYDASQVCLELWQVGMLIFGVVFAVPFPIALLMAMRLLEQGKMSALAFFLCCLWPLLGIVFMCLCSYSSKPSEEQISKSGEKILYMLQGQFRKDPKHMTIHWEAIICVRRLLISAMALLQGYGSVRMIILSCLCILFLMQHIYRLPFYYRTSNHVESLSLSLLLIFSVFNLLKASLTDSGVVPTGPTVDFFKALEFIEKLFPFIIIVVIIIIEIRRIFKKKSKNQ